MLNNVFRSDLDRTGLAQRTRDLIVRSGLSVSELSRSTRSMYGTQSSYFIADTFISKIRKGVAPHLCQVAALSELTSYRFPDLMQHFGFDLRHLVRLQARLHQDSTVLIAPYEYFASSSTGESRYLYAKIGRRDGMAFPEIMPGSIVRIDTTQTAVVHTSKGTGRPPLYVVDHVRGISCCYVTALSDGEILLTPHYLPYPCLQYRLGEQAKILGLVDAELRLSQGIEVPTPPASHRRERRVPITALEAPQRISQLVRNSRDRVGLQFRQARDMTACVGEELGSHEYAIALGTLSDYEAVDTVPRHIPKIFSLCIVYAIDFTHYLRCAGITLSLAAQKPVTERSQLDPTMCYASLCQDGADSRPISSPPYFPVSLIQTQKELLQNHSGQLETYTVSNVQNGDHLPDVKLFIVDRCSTKLDEGAWPAAWQRPVYVVRKRDGKYLYGFCTVTEGILTVHQDPAMTSIVDRCYHKEVDVVGRVVTMLRNVR